MTAKKAPGFATRLAIVISVLLLAANLLLGVILVGNSRTALKTLIDNRMLDISNTAADMLDGDVLARLTAEDTDTPEYKAVNDTLAVFQNNIDLRYIYCIYDNGDGNFTFGVDPTVEDPGVFGNPIVSTDALVSASKGTAAVDSKPYIDEWGRFYSAYSPVFASDGKVAGIVAVDFSADWYDQQISKQSRAIIISSAVSVMVGLLLVFIATARLRKEMKTMTNEILEMTSDINELTREITPDYSSAEEYDDNVHELGGHIHRIKEDLREYTLNLHSQANSMITALSSEYRSVYYINLDKDEGICYQEHSELDNGLKQGEHFSYLKKAQDYANDYVTEKYRDEFLKFIDPQNVRKALEKERIITFRYMISRNGQEAYEMLRMAGVRHPEDRDDHMVHAIGMGFTDVDIETRRTLSQSQALSDALTVAEEANKAKTAFLSNMSHEIRTPMNAIIGLDSLALRDTSLSVQTREYLVKIGESARHLLGLINDILDMSRIESGRLVLRNEEFSFTNMIAQISTMIQSQCNEKGLEFDCKLLNDIDDWYYGDDMKLKQVIINILSNAIKFTDAPGNVKFTVQKIAEFDDQSTLRFLIKDTGIGMNAEFLPKIFEPFTQEDAGRSNKFGSTGLGMAITKNIVEMMNGTIDVISEKGVGSEFIVTVTLKNCDKTSDGVNEVNPHSIRALVIDDDQIALEHARMVLEEVGIHTETCTSGNEALTTIEIQQAKQNPYNLILIDWKMPELDGVEVTRLIRSKYNDEATIIILTAYNWDEVMDEALDAGVDSFMSKPLFANNVLEEFERVFKRKNLSQISKKNQIDLNGKHILLAEDILINAEIMKQLLKIKGIGVDHAENGEKTVELFENSEIGYYDAILMDVRMPVMDGLEASAAIRKLDRPDAVTVPIIAMTANAFDEDVQRSLQAGMNAHLSKPVEPERLYDTLCELIKE